MRQLPPSLPSYGWAPTTEELAARFGLSPKSVLRFDGNVPASPPSQASPEVLATALREINTYGSTVARTLIRAIAEYAGVGPENVVIGPGSDDLILLCARAFLAPGDMAAITTEPTYPVYRIAVALAGAEVGAEAPSVTFCCRPNNPDGMLYPLPEGRPLVVDEAYFEYAGVTALNEITDDVVVLRTFSKAFGIAGARIGYALAREDIAAELRKRQAPLSTSLLSTHLALALLESPPDVSPQLEERERLADRLRALGLAPLPSWANFLYVPLQHPDLVYERLLADGCVARPYPDAIRLSVRTKADDDCLLDALARALESH